MNLHWVVLIENDGKGKFYFVVETKGSTWLDDLRYHEGAKIKCEEKYFEEIATEGNPAKYIKVKIVNEMMGDVET